MSSIRRIDNAEEEVVLSIDEIDYKAMDNYYDVTEGFREMWKEEFPLLTEDHQFISHISVTFTSCSKLKHNNYPYSLNFFRVAYDRNSRLIFYRSTNSLEQIWSFLSPGNPDSPLFKKLFIKLI
jgi:hypothetical protein